MCLGIQVALSWCKCSLNSGPVRQDYMHMHVVYMHVGCYIYRILCPGFGPGSSSDLPWNPLIPSIMRRLILLPVFPTPQLNVTNPRRPEQPLERKPPAFLLALGAPSWLQQFSLHSWRNWMHNASKFHRHKPRDFSLLVVACRPCLACSPNFPLSFYVFYLVPFPSV